MEGGIFVWIQYEGRWSVELVNDRGAQVDTFFPPVSWKKSLHTQTILTGEHFFPAGEWLHLVTWRNSSPHRVPGWLCVGWLRQWAKTLVLRDQPWESNHLWYLDARWSAGTHYVDELSLCCKMSRKLHLGWGFPLALNSSLSRSWNDLSNGLLCSTVCQVLNAPEHFHH